MLPGFPTRSRSLVTLVALLLVATGCQHQQCCVTDSQMGRELSKVTLPPYVIEPPDVLLVDAVRIIPLPPYHIEPLDVLRIQVKGLPDALPAIDGVSTVDTGGRVDLGIDYGSIGLAGMTLEDAQTAIEKHLTQTKTLAKPPKALVALVQPGASQQIRGPHLVKMDGVINLGTYGSVYVTGMTVPEATAAIEQHLSRFLANPKISLDVIAYNSKVYYVIFDGGGYGQQLVRQPITGNETVLDAISTINGLPAQASRKRIWVARPAPATNGCEGHDQILPVDWKAITQCGRTETNYQLLPGDRLYVQADIFITIDNGIAKIVNPLERAFGAVILGNAMVHELGNKGGTGATNSTGTGF